MLKLSNRSALRSSQASRHATAPMRVSTVARAEEAQASNTCKKCGVDMSKVDGLCDQEGRVVGGMGALPGFGWWPIKAYRPCPNLELAGVEYTSYVPKSAPNVTYDLVFPSFVAVRSRTSSMAGSYRCLCSSRRLGDILNFVTIKVASTVEGGSPSP
eukprot:gene23090-30284_t